MYKNFNFWSKLLNIYESHSKNSKPHSERRIFLLQQHTTTFYKNRKIEISFSSFIRSGVLTQQKIGRNDII